MLKIASILFAFSFGLSSLAFKSTVSAQDAANDKVVIREAVYGDLPDGNKVTVTEKVAKLVKDGKLMLEVGNDLFGDPAEQVQKKLRVKYELGGKSLEATVEEGETMLLPQPKLVGELKILSAKYGDVPDGDTFDVVDLVKKHVKDNRLEIAVDNDTLGDPASGVYKRLRVEYQIGDVKLFKSVYEGGKMVIAAPAKETKKDDAPAKKEDTPAKKEDAAAKKDSEAELKK